MTFALHPQLQADTAFIADWPLCRVSLMNDARFPWLILVPRRAGVTEMHDLADEDIMLLTQEIMRASKMAKSWAQSLGTCDKINIAMIGNIVPQLHVHVVARTKTDSAWPYPVWGRGEAVRYDGDELQRRLKELSRAAAQ